jgi:HEAT repeat protein
MNLHDSTRADLESADRRRRRHAAKRLAQTPDAEAVPLLITLVGDEHEDVRSSALVALAASGDLRAREPALAVLARENEDDFVQREALFVLGALADDASISGLRAVASTSPNAMLREEATLILAGKGSPSVGPS